MIVARDPVPILIENYNRDSFDFLCPLLTEHFREFVSGPIMGHIEITGEHATVQISGECPEGIISVAVSDDYSVAAFRKARREFAHIMQDWLQCRFGQGWLVDSELADLQQLTTNYRTVDKVETLSSGRR